MSLDTPPAAFTVPMSNISMPRWTPAVHRVMYAIDIVGYSSRDDQTHLHLRNSLRDLTGQAAAAAGVPLDSCYHEDRGDGILVITPPDTPPEAILGLFQVHLHAALRRHNRLASQNAHMRLRVSVEGGFVSFDAHGVSGRAVIHLFRLNEAPVFKAMLNTSGADIGVITSTNLYNEVVRSAPGILDPSAYMPVTVINKEFHSPAWVTLPSTPTIDPSQDPNPLTRIAVETSLPRI